MRQPKYWLAGTLVACCLAISANAQYVTQVVNSIVATTCTNQFIRSLAVTGAGTCASVAIGSDVSGLGTGVATFLATPSSANLATAVTGETGSGALVFGTAPSMSDPTITGSFTATGLVANAALANMANSTLKCRTTAGTGVPENCTAGEAAAIIGAVGGTLKSKLLTITRDLTVASGSVAYTGMGFQPTSCVANGMVTTSATQYITHFAMSDSARTSSSTAFFAGTIITTNFLVLADVTAANFQVANIASYDSDGFTLTWVKTASPTGTATIQVMCHR